MHLLLFVISLSSISFSLTLYAFRLLFHNKTEAWERIETMLDAADDSPPLESPNKVCLRVRLLSVDVSMFHKFSLTLLIMLLHLGNNVYNPRSQGNTEAVRRSVNHVRYTTP